MSPHVPFRCGVDNGTKGGWCFADSTCMIDADGVEYCIECAPGYQHDYTWGHFENCGMPYWFFPLLLGLSSLWCWSTVLVLLRSFKTIPKPTHQLVRLYMLLLILEWSENTALYAEGGRFVATSILVGLRTIAATEFNLHLILLLVKSLSPRLRDFRYRETERRYRASALTPACMFMILCFVQASFSRAENDVFNVIVLVNFSFGALHFAVMMISCYYLIHVVLQTVRKNGPLPARTERQVNLLRMMRNILTSVSVWSTITCIYVVIVLTWVGTIPYAWAMTFFLSGFGMTGPVFIYFIGKYSKRRPNAGNKELPTGHSPDGRPPKRCASSYSPWRSRSRLASTLALQHPPSIPIWFADIETSSNEVKACDAFVPRDHESNTQ